MLINTYSKYHGQFSGGWQAASLAKLETAVKEEMQHDIYEGYSDGIPVVADGLVAGPSGHIALTITYCLEW